MDRKDLERMVLEKEQVLDGKKERGLKTASKKSYKTRQGMHHKENHMAMAYELRGSIDRYTKIMSKLERGQTDIQGALGELAPDALMKLVELLKTGQEKSQLEAAKEIMDRSGHTKINKVAIAGSLDPNSSKEELISTIMGLGKKTGAIEVVEDDKTEPSEADED